MKSDCNIIRDLVSTYTDGIASDATNEIIEEHLAECVDCRDFYKTFVNVGKEMPTEPQNISIPESFRYDEKYLSLSNLLKRKKKIKNSSLVAMGVVIGVSLALNIALLKKISDIKKLF